MKHEFKEGDGMSKETSTPEERKEIFELLQNEGYKVDPLTGSRGESNFDRDLVFYLDEFTLPYYGAIANDYTYQEMKCLITGEDIPGENWSAFGFEGSEMHKEQIKEEFLNSQEEKTITVTREELMEACEMIGNGHFKDFHHYTTVLINNIEQIQSKLPTIILSGLNKDIKYVAMDKDGRVFFYLDSPKLYSAWWWEEGNYTSAEFIDQSLLNQVRECDWKKSLHKVKHV